MRRRHRLHRRYGRASHPLFPRLVMYLEKVNVGHTEPAFIYVVKGKLQPHYGAEWKNVLYNEYDTVQRARAEFHRVGAVVAAEHGVPASHVEYA